MKKSNKKNTNGGSPINRFNIVFVDAQIIFTILTVVLAVVYLFHKQVELYFELSLILNLLVMALNNQLVYKRSRMTIVYLLAAILLFICMVI